MQILQNVWTALTTENEGLVALINIPLSFIEAYLSLLIFTSFFNITTTAKKISIYILVFPILGCISRVIIPEPYGGLCLTLSFVQF